MKYLYLTLLSIIILACSDKPAPKLHHKGSLLWKISGNGLKSPSYLFGTYHLLGKQFADSLDIEKEIKLCKAVAGEMVIDSFSPKKSLAAMQLPNGTLKDLFTPEEYDSIATVFHMRSRVTMEQLDNFKPAAVEVALMATLSPKKISPGTPMLDKYIQEKGKSLGEKIIGFETPEQQIDLLFNAPIEAQKRRLLLDVRDIDIAQKNVNKAYRLYCEQDVDGMYDLTKTDKEFSPAEQDAMLKNRNLNWIEKIPAIISAQPTFIAVGALHLGGPYGLIKQLKLKGYKVDPVAI